MPDPAILTNLGVSGFAIWVLWMAYKLFVQRLKEKDAEHAIERREFLERLDKRDAAFRTLESDIRNTFSTSIVENTNTLRQMAIYVAKRRKRG